MSFESAAGGREESRLRLVTDVLRSFADATTDYARLLQTIVERIGGLMGHACSIRLLSADREQLETAAMFDPAGSPMFARFAGSPIPVTAALKDALDHQRAYVEDHPLVTAGAPPVTRVLVAPLVARGAALGCLFVVQQAPDAAPFRPEDVELVDALARHAALALANARLMSSLETLEQVHQQERTILDTILAPLLLLDRESRVVHANRAFGNTFGVDVATLPGQGILDVAGRLFDVPGASEKLGQLPPARGIEEWAVDLATPKGHRTFELRAKKTFRPGDSGEGSLITLADITERLAAERLMKRQALLISSMNEAIIGLDPDFRVEEWNPAAERVFGWTADEVRGKPAADVFNVTSGNHRERNRKLLRDGETVRSEVRIKSRHGTWVDVEFSTMPIMEDGVAQGYVCLMHDITERNRLDAELRARVEELTASNLELESFSYSVSHDLRAPIRAIDGFAEILEQEHASGLDPEGRRLLDTVRKNAKRMGLLIDDLLALARYSRQPIVPEKIDMSALARATLDEALRAEPERKIATSMTPLPPAVADEGLLRQVWLNLYSNAIKYTRGRPDAAIETSATETESELIYVVKDNGAGFDMRHADKLFGTFERLHTAKEFEGTGIGLALVSRIVKRHGGRVWGQGEVDRGASFSFALPKPNQEAHDDL
jgi:PAS domain S-box-containing protein